MTDEEIEKAIYVRLDNLLDLAYHSLEIKRKTITKLLDEGFYPYTKAYLGTFANHFSTIGIVGMNELLLNIFKGTEASNTDIATERGQKISMDILSHIRENSHTSRLHFRSLVYFGSSGKNASSIYWWNCSSYFLG